MSRFELVTPIAAPPERVFDLSLQVEIHTASMSGSHERAVGGVTSGRLELGDTVTWQARHLGLGWRMTSLISACDPPHSFVDEQVEGPFARWHHIHRFAANGTGGTVMTDVVEFAAPLGPLGRIAESAVLDRYMQRLIRLRNQHLKRAAEADGEPAG
jgi:ligand-binding SRPBCC domain-containing protein